MRVILTSIVILLCTRSALADSRPLYELPSGVTPRSLQMRASAWRTSAAAISAKVAPNSDAKLSEPMEDETGTRDRPSHDALAQDVLAPPKPLSERLTLRFNVGMGLDGGQPSGKLRLSGATLDERNDYERLRIYSFGDAVLGTRGLGMPGLGTYLAAHGDVPSLVNFR